MHKFIFTILLFFFLNLISCSEVNPVVGSVCEITTEICYYAEIICESFPSEKNISQENLKIKNDLQELSSQLKKETEILKLNKLSGCVSSDFNFKHRLILIRNSLKDINDQQKKD